MQSMVCHSDAEQLMAARATDEDVKNKTVRQLEAGSTSPEPGLEAHRSPCEVVGSDEEFSTGECVPGFSKMDIEGQEAIKRSLLHTRSQKIDDSRRNEKQEGEVL